MWADRAAIGHADAVPDGVQFLDGQYLVAVLDDEA
jgi:hypothetical protein